MILVTPSKQWIHFFLSDRWPPTSNILQTHTYTRGNRMNKWAVKALFLIFHSIWILLFYDDEHPRKTEAGAQKPRVTARSTWGPRRQTESTLSCLNNTEMKERRVLQHQFNDYTFPECFFFSSFFLFFFMGLQTQATEAITVIVSPIFISTRER